MSNQTLACMDKCSTVQAQAAALMGDRPAQLVFNSCLLAPMFCPTDAIATLISQLTVRPGVTHRHILEGKNCGCAWHSASSSPQSACGNIVLSVMFELHQSIHAECNPSLPCSLLVLGVCGHAVVRPTLHSPCEFTAKTSSPV